MKVKELWSARLTSDMVENLDQDKIEELVDALSDAVAFTCEDFGVE